jgi:GDPmannose 4,6-dehydratase
MARTALITGITGQDGSYLAELLLEKGYEVHGIVRRSSSVTRTRIDHLGSYERGADKRLFLHYGDLTDSVSLVKLLYQLQPDEIYNLAAQSHVRVSFDIPEYTGDVTGIGAQRILEAIIESDIGKKVRYYQASSSEMFGKVQAVPQTESTPFWPRSPYACAKVYAHWLTVNYRESYNLFACSGILFNHESPRRGHNFVTRKITIALGNILKGKQETLSLGNINSLRDWGHAKDYIKGMYLMLQQDKPEDYILSTNEYHSVREFVEKSFALRGFDIQWKGDGVNEIGYDSNTGRELVFVLEKYFRPSEVEELLGDSTKARTELGWEPSYSFDELVREMVENDCK